MAEFILTGFGDEIDASLDRQMEVMDGLGIHFIETRGIDGKNIADYTPEEARAIHARMADRGFGVSALGSPVGKIGIHDDFAPHLENFKRLIEVAHAMQTKYIRLFSFFIPENENPADLRDEVMARMSALVEANRGSGVQLLHENEKFIYGDTPERCLDLLKTFAGDILCTYDPSNFVQCGVDNKAAFEMLKPYIHYMHIKDSVYSKEHAALDRGFDKVADTHRPAGQGDGQVKWILSQLKAADFHGFASIEPHLSNNDSIPGTGVDKFTVAANALKGLLAEI